MSEEQKPKTVTVNRATKRAILKPWRSRKAQRQAARERAAWDIEFRERVMQALQGLDQQKAEQEQAG